MKAFLCVSALVCSFGVGASSLADTHVFECPVKEEKQTVLVRFGVEKLGQLKKARLTEVKGSDEDGPISVEPKTLKDGSQSVLTTLNGQGGDLRMSKDRLTLFGDSAGIQYVYLVLYKSSDFTRGWVRFEGPEGEGSWYQTIECTHRVD